MDSKDEPGGYFTEKKITCSGFIAQVAEVAAKSIGFDFSEVDAHENEYYGLRYAEFVVPLVKAVQEQQLMIEQLQQANAELLRRLYDLEKK